MKKTTVIGTFHGSVLLEPKTFQAGGIQKEGWDKVVSTRGDLERVIIKVFGRSGRGDAVYTHIVGAAR